MRLDAHHSFSDRYPLATLDTILKRNRFDGSILVAPTIPDSLPEFIRGVVVETDCLDDRLQAHPLFRGICCTRADFAELARRGFTLDFTGDLADLPAIAGRYPDLRIVIDRLGDPAALAATAQFPNVFCKLSGIVGNQQALVQRAIDVFGPERLMFGSGWPALLPEHAWKASLAGFTQSIGARSIEFRGQILGLTAAHFYGIG